MNRAFKRMVFVDIYKILKNAALFINYVTEAIHRFKSMLDYTTVVSISSHKKE